MTIYELKYNLLLFLLFMSVGSFGQQPVATATLDTNAMLIGDQVLLTLQFSGPSDAQIAWPMIPDTILEKIDVLEREKIDTLIQEESRTTSYSQNILLTCFDTGFYVIPPIPFYYRVLPDTTIFLAETRMHFLAVHTLAVDTTKPIKPIKGPMRAPLTFREILPWIIVGLVAVGLIIFLIYYLRKRKKKEPVFRIRPRIKLKPHEVALTEFEKLRVKKLWQKGKVKIYYTELTDILRHYIEGRFNVAAMESTSAEILHDLLGVKEINRSIWDEVGKLLMQADMVKFAKEIPTPDENERNLEKGIQFVNDTMQRDDPTPTLPLEGRE